MKIANEIKKMALAHGKSISTLAKDLGVLQPQLSRTINNPRISLDDMQKIADVIGCKVGDFFADDMTEEEANGDIVTIQGKKYIVKPLEDK